MGPGSARKTATGKRNPECKVVRGKIDRGEIGKNTVHVRSSSDLVKNLDCTQPIAGSGAEKRRGK